VKIAGQTAGFVENILTFFSSGIGHHPEQNPKHFTRKRKLPFARLLVFVLHLVCGDTKGVDIKSGLFFKMARRDDIREHFDPDCGLQSSGKGHYPQALVSTAFDVFRRIPVARTVMPNNASERKEAMAMLDHMPSGIVLFDRGYPSYEFILYLMENYAGHFLFRCPASNTFPAVVSFLASEAEDGIIEIAPSETYRSKLSVAARRDLTSLTVRIVRVTLPNGEIAVYLTDLLDSATFSCEEIADLYRRR